MQSLLRLPVIFVRETRQRILTKFNTVRCHNTETNAEKGILCQADELYIEVPRGLNC